MTPIIDCRVPYAGDHFGLFVEGSDDPLKPLFVCRERYITQHHTGFITRGWGDTPEAALLAGYAHWVQFPDPVKAPDPETAAAVDLRLAYAIIVRNSYRDAHGLGARCWVCA